MCMKIYINIIYQKIQFTYSFPNGGTYRQNLKDIFQYKYYSIDEFISFYDSLVKINYGEKEETMIIYFTSLKEEIFQIY